MAVTPDAFYKRIVDDGIIQGGLFLKLDIKIGLFIIEILTILYKAVLLS